MRILPAFPLLLLACAAPQTPCPAVPASPAATREPASTPAASTPPSPSPGSLAVLLRPLVDPTPRVHVEIELDAPRVPVEWPFVRAVGDRVSALEARDARGDLGAKVSAQKVTLGRTPEGAVHLVYEVRATDDALGDPLGEYVAADRFRGSGEGLLALPAGMNATYLTLRIDGEPLKVPNAASSLGLGATRRTRGRPELLQRASFLAGSLGGAVFDDPGSNHDETAWLGYTAFDPRPAGAELAQMRTAIDEVFKAHDEPPWTYLMVAQTRSIGAFTATSRADGVLLQLGPGEPWSAPLRLGMAQLVARRFVGGALRTTFEGLDAAGNAAFDAGIARYVAMQVLAGLSLMSPAEVHDAVVGEIAALATLPHGGGPKGAMSEAELVARGALYALAQSAASRARPGGRPLAAALSELYAPIRDAHGAREVDARAWAEALKEDADAGKRLAAWLDKTQVPALPGDALGPCYRAGTGEYVAYDPGFDLEATRVAKDGRVSGVRSDGPAAKGGLREGDLIEEMAGREGDAAVPVRLTLTREGKRAEVTYLPRGARGKGQTWTRVKGVGEERCAEVR